MSPALYLHVQRNPLGFEYLKLLLLGAALTHTRVQYLNFRNMFFFILIFIFGPLEKNWPALPQVVHFGIKYETFS